MFEQNKQGPRANLTTYILKKVDQNWNSEFWNSGILAFLKAVKKMLLGKIHELSRYYN